MFQIRTKNKSIATTPDAALSLTFVNPAFDAQDRAFSLPFTAVGDVENGATAELVLDGLPVMRGVIERVRSKRRVSECAIKNIPTRIVEILQGLKINEILPTIDVFAGIDSTSFQGVILEPIVGLLNYTVTIKGNVFTKSYTTAPTHQEVVTDMMFLINATLPNFAGVLSGTIYSIKCKNVTLYETFDFDWTALVGFTVTTETYPADFQEAAIRTKFLTEQAQFVLPLFQAGFLYNFKNNAFNGYVNDNRNGAITANDWHETMQCDHTFCPQIRFDYILRKALDIVEAQIGENITVVVPAPHDQTIEEITLFNVVTIDNFLKEPHKTSPTSLYKNAYTRTIDLNRHVPGITAMDMIEGVCEIFQLYFQYENGVFSFLSKRDQFEMGVVEMNKDIDGRLETNHKTPQGFTLAFAKDEQEMFAPFPDLVVGGTKRVETKAGTVAFQNAGLPMMETQKIGTSTPLSISSKTPLRLFFYKGFKTYASVTYPFGTPLNALPNGTTDGVTSIKWEGAQGLYAKAWKDVAETTYDGSGLKIVAWLTALQIINLKSWKMPLIRFYTEGGYRKGIVKQIQTRVRVRPQTRYECELELYEL